MSRSRKEKEKLLYLKSTKCQTKSMLASVKSNTVSSNYWSWRRSKTPWFQCMLYSKALIFLWIQAHCLELCLVCMTWLAGHMLYFRSFPLAPLNVKLHLVSSGRNWTTDFIQVRTLAYFSSRILKVGFICIEFIGCKERLKCLLRILCSNREIHVELIT